MFAGLVLGATIIALTDSYRRELTGWAQDDPLRALNLILPVIAVTVVVPWSWPPGISGGSAPAPSASSDFRLLT